MNITIPYHFSSSVKSATSSGQRTNASRARRLAQEIASLSTSLPLSYSSSVFVRCDDERLDIMKVSQYRDSLYGCFVFAVKLSNARVGYGIKARLSRNLNRVLNSSTQRKMS